jgi:hypothetical protein
VIAVESIPQTILDHGINHLEIAHFHPAAKVRAVRRLTHGFLTSGDYDLGITVEDCLIAERNRPQPRAAQLVDAPSRRFHRNARGDRSLPCGILPLPGGEDLTEDDLGNLRLFHPSALERLLDRDLAQFVCRQRRERPIESPDRRAGCADDDNIVSHSGTPIRMRLDG